MCVYARARTHIVSQRSVLHATLRNAIHFHLDRLFPWPVVLLVGLSLSPALGLQVHTTILRFIVFMWILSIQLSSLCLQSRYLIPILSLGTDISPKWKLPEPFESTPELRAVPERTSRPQGKDRGLCVLV